MGQSIHNNVANWSVRKATGEGDWLDFSTLDAPWFEGVFAVPLEIANANLSLLQSAMKQMAQLKGYSQVREADLNGLIENYFDDFEGAIVDAIGPYL